MSTRDAQPLMLDVVDHNGVHAYRVLYCDCPSSEKKWEQLCQVDLFPGTMKSPGTAFSFSVLKQFDILSSVSKASTMDFVTTLRRITNNAFIDDVPVIIHSLLPDFYSSTFQDFYNVFRRVVRVWRSIQTQKRAGEYHGMKELLGDNSDFFLACEVSCMPATGF